MEITKVDFGSLLTYTPRGNQTKHHKSRAIMRKLKNDAVLQSGNLMSSLIAQIIRNELDGYPFSDYFNETTMLIPTPKSSMLQKDGLWVPQRITSALENKGLGINEECLIRNTPLPKSSKVSAPDRPKAFQHYESMGVRESLLHPREIVLVDDVITRGATALGAVNKIKEAFPNASIRVFAAMRTIRNSDDFSDFFEPRTGKIELVGVNTFRHP